MNQALYAHMNNKRKIKKKRSLLCLVLCAFMEISLAALTPKNTQQASTIFSYKGYLGQTSRSRVRKSAMLQFEPRDYFCMYHSQL
jgi:hypothetical protein